MTYVPGLLVPGAASRPSGSHSAPRPGTWSKMRAPLTPTPPGALIRFLVGDAPLRGPYRKIRSSGAGTRTGLCADVIKPGQLVYPRSESGSGTGFRPASYTAGRNKKRRDRGRA